MAIKLISAKWCGVRESYVKEFLMDSESDRTELPECCVGSTALAVNTGNIYVVNTSGDWIAFGQEG